MSVAKSDYYDLLGVSKNASLEEIKNAYRKQALKWHPDRHQGADKEMAEKRFKEINEAYQVLSDPQKRQAYDQFGHQAFAPGGGMGSAGRAGNPFGGFGSFGPFTYTYTYTSENPFGGTDFGDPFDIFEQFFGSASPFRRNRLPRYSITIDFMEAMKGAEKEIVVNGKKRKVKIPAGVDDGTRIQFDDFVLSINVKPSNIYERDGQDLYITEVIPISMAILGGEIKVPTIDGDVKLKIRPGTQSNSMIRLRERGVPGLRHQRRGDQYVRIHVAIPEKLTSEQRNLVNQLRLKGL
ncbi:MAG: DnaJ domain-containing protein [Patescibacteria group bacterium]|nr:DnaJ domain-containing protein [Patescibacteria group bacterium]